MPRKGAFQKGRWKSNKLPTSNMAGVSNVGMFAKRSTGEGGTDCLISPVVGDLGDKGGNKSDTGFPSLSDVASEGDDASSCIRDANGSTDPASFMFKPMDSSFVGATSKGGTLPPLPEKYERPIEVF